MNTAYEKAYRHFTDALKADLIQNSKPVIISLSMLAEDYKQNSNAITKSIEDYIRLIPAEIKILGLYLMDSIMKNHKATTNYVEIFEMKIVSLFKHVFEFVDEHNRKSLYKLRQTWNEVFSNRILHEIDVTIQRIDPAWPITASINSISPEAVVPKKNINNNNNLVSINKPVSAPAVITGTSQSNGSQKSVGGLPKSAPILTSSNSNNHLAPPSNLLAQISISTSQELPKESKQQQQQQQQNRLLSPSNQTKKIDSTTRKPSQNIVNDSNAEPGQATRDPRLINRKPKPVQQPFLHEHSFDRHASPPPTTMSPKQVNNKKQQPNQPTSQLNGLKRTSPNSIQNPNEIKKPKLTATSTNTGSELKSNKPSTNQQGNVAKQADPSKQAKPLVKKVSSPNQPAQDSGETKNALKATARDKPVKHKLDMDQLSFHSQSTKPLSKSNKLNKLEDNKTMPVEGENANKRSISANLFNTTNSSREKTVNNGNNDTSSQAAQKKIPSLFELKLPSTVPNNVNTNMSKTKGTFVKQPQQQQQQNQTAAAAKSSHSLIKTKSNQQLTPNKHSKAESTNKKPAPNNSVNGNGETVNESVAKTELPSKTKSSKQPMDVAFGNDVDERFVYENNPPASLEQPKQQQGQVSLSALLSGDKSLKGSANDLIENLLNATKSIQGANSSTSSSSHETFMLLQQQQQKQQAPVETSQGSEFINEVFLKNKSSINELEQKLELSKQHDVANNATTSSSKTEELMEMIRKLIGQQDMLIEQKKDDQLKESVLNEPAKSQIECLMDTRTPAPSNLFNESQNKFVSSPPSRGHHHQPPQQEHDSYFNDVTYDLPPIKPRDKNENQNDSLLIIDGRSYRIQPEMLRLIKVYYHDHELFCDTRTKEVYIDKKRVYKMGDQTKEVMLNGRKVRLMYMGRRIELWIDGISFHLRADSPAKQISVTSSQSNQIKRFYVTIDSRTMDMYFNNYKVCQINGGPHGPGPSKLMAKLAPDDYEMHEISFLCPPKRIMIDGIPRTMRYDLAVPCIEMSGGLFHVIRFSGPPREIYIDDMPFTVAFDKTIRIKLNGRAHELAWGGPGFEVIIDGRPYELQFNKPPREITIGTRPHSIYICGDAPDVKICGQLPYELLQQSQDENSNVMNSNDMDGEMVPRFSKLPSLMNQQPKVSCNFEKPPPSVQHPSILSLNLPQQSSLLQPNTSSNCNNNNNNNNKSSPPDLQELLKKLTDQGLLPLANKDSKQAATSSDSKKVALPSNLTKLFASNDMMKRNDSANDLNTFKEPEKIPDLTNFDTELLKHKYQGAIQSLYSGIQCATCGNRFNQHDSNATTSGGSRYSKHLDWHFRQNKKEKDEINKAHSRAWYYVLHEWIQYEELSEEAANLPDTDSTAPAGTTEVDQGKRKHSKHGKSSLINDSEYSSDEGDEQVAENALLEDISMCNRGAGRDLNSTSSLNAFGSTNGTTCPATDDIDDSCCICNDPFEIFWYVEKEEWHFKDALRVDNRVYHPICFEDARDDNTSFANNTNLTTPGSASKSKRPNRTSLNSNEELANSFLDETVDRSLSTSITVKDEPNEEQPMTDDSVDQSIMSMQAEQLNNVTVEMNPDEEEEQLESDTAATTKTHSNSFPLNVYEENFKDEPKTP